MDPLFTLVLLGLGFAILAGGIANAFESNSDKKPNRSPQTSQGEAVSRYQNANTALVPTGYHDLYDPYTILRSQSLLTPGCYNLGRENPIPVVPAPQLPNTFSHRALVAHAISAEEGSTAVMAAVVAQQLAKRPDCGFADISVEIESGQPYTTFFGRHKIADPFYWKKTISVRLR